MLTVTRQRGKYWYIGGTVKVGKKTLIVQEFSSGTSSKREAEVIARNEEQKVKNRELHGEGNKNDYFLFDQCLETVLKIKTLKSNEIQRIEFLLPHFQGKSISEMKSACTEFLKKNAHLKPSSKERYLATIRSILNFAAKYDDFIPPKIEKIHFNNKRLVYLTKEQRANLLKCYAKHVKPIFITLAYQGRRSQETLQIDFQNVDLKGKWLYFETTKNGEPLRVPMHKRVFWEIARIWIKRKKPKSGKVFLTQTCKPFKDTRGMAGGYNPLKTSHKNALEKYNKAYPDDQIKTFRIHDWRHDWASWMFMRGANNKATQEIGGWKDSKSMDRYVTLSKDHLKAEIAKLK